MMCTSDPNTLVEMAAEPRTLIELLSVGLTGRVIATNVVLVYIRIGTSPESHWGSDNCQEPGSWDG